MTVGKLSAHCLGPGQRCKLRTPLQSPVPELTEQLARLLASRTSRNEKKEKGELVIPIAEELKAGAEKSVGAMAAPGLGSLKLVKTAWGIPGAPAEPPPNWGEAG